MNRNERLTDMPAMNLFCILNCNGHQTIRQPPNGTKKRLTYIFQLCIFNIMILNKVIINIDLELNWNEKLFIPAIHWVALLVCMRHGTAVCNSHPIERGSRTVCSNCLLLFHENGCIPSHSPFYICKTEYGSRHIQIVGKQQQQQNILKYQFYHITRKWDSERISRFVCECQFDMSRCSISCVHEIIATGSLLNTYTICIYNLYLMHITCLRLEGIACAIATDRGRHMRR